jgi:hypothetical protein
MVHDGTRSQIEDTAMKLRHDSGEQRLFEVENTRLPAFFDPATGSSLKTAAFARSASALTRKADVLTPNAAVLSSNVAAISLNVAP